MLRQVAKRLKVDVILLQEIWHPTEENMKIRDYPQKFIRTRQGKEGGGVGIWVHRKVKAVYLEKYVADNLEAVWAEVKVGRIRTVVGSVYIPPGDTDALDTLDMVIGDILRSHEHLVVCMDANSRNVRWDNSCIGVSHGQKSVKMGIKLEEIMDKYSLHIHNNGQSTYSSGNVSTAPDVTLSTGIHKFGNIKWCIIDDDLNTPHEGILFGVGEQSTAERKEVIDWKSFQWKHYKEESGSKLSKLKERWISDPLLSCDDMVKELDECISECVEKVAVKKVVTLHSKPWIDRQVAEQLKRLRQARKRCRLRRSRVNVAEYDRLQKEVVEAVKKAEQEWWLEECDKIVGASQREKWKIINYLTNQAGITEVQPIKKPINGDVVYLFEDEEIRVELEDYHIRRTYMKQNEVEESVIRDVEHYASVAKDTTDGSALMNDEILDCEVSSTFGKGSDTAGPDGIQAKLIDKAERTVMHECLKILWNKAWCNGYFMREWKMENRVIIPKPGKENYNDCNSYRTVSVTACVGKRFEYITSQRLMILLECGNFDRDQYAYLKKRSGTQALLLLVEKVKKGMLNGQKAGAVFFDYSDAFGSVNRTRLLHKIGKDFGITGRLFLHIQSFLSDRCARLKIDKIFGDWIDSNDGTSAGTRLGPLLFIMYIHDVPKCIVPKFADDLVSVVIEKDVDLVKEHLQYAVKQLVDWSRENDMVLNASKTKVMIFGNTNDEVRILVDGVVIEQVNSYKYLGVLLDAELDFGKQVDFVIGKTKRALGKVLSLIDGRRGVPVHTGITLYKTLVRPHLEYAMPVWANISDKDVSRLEEVQSQSLRRILGAKAHSSTAAVEVISGVYPIRIRKRELCCREYIRIVCMVEDHPLVQLMACTMRVGMRFCPLEYIRVMSKELERKIKGCVIESCCGRKVDRLIQRDNLMCVDIKDIDEGSNVESTGEGEQVDSDYISRLIEVLTRDHVLVFTDGSVYSPGSAGSVGCGACAAVLFPASRENCGLQIKTQAVGTRVSSEKCEIEGLLLGMEMVIRYMKEINTKGVTESVYIFCDCQRAIDILVKQGWPGRHPEIFERVLGICEQLKDISCVVKLVKILGHAGITGNVIADREAKEAAKKIVTGQLKAPAKVSIDDARKLSTEIAMTSWQRQWDEHSKGRKTYEMIPEVGTKVMWPKTRDTAISYCRILLHDTLLKSDAFRTGISTSSVCECGYDSETVEHFILHCPKYDSARSPLIDIVDPLWHNVKANGFVFDTLHLVVAPRSDHTVTRKDDLLVKSALFDFLISTNRQL